MATLGLTVYSNIRINRALGDRNVAYQQLQDEQRKTDEARRTALAKADEIRIGLENLNAANVLVERGRAYIDSPHQPHLIMTSAAQALASFDRAVVLRPDHSIARDARGRMLCRLGLFAEAAPDMAQAYALRPPTDDTLDSWSYDVWFRYACLRAQVGDLAGYRKVCADMHQQEISPSDVGGASYWMARTCVLAPGAMDDPQEVVRLAQAAVEKNKAKENHFALGMAHSRR